MSKTWIRRTLLAGLLAAATVPSWAAAPAHAEEAPAAEGNKPKAKGKAKASSADRRKQRVEAEAKRLDKRAERLRGEGKADEAKAAESRAAKLRKGAKAEGKRRGKAKSPSETRKLRKYQKLKSLRKKYGKGLEDPVVRSELALHAERRAKLQRMKKVAETSSKPELAERVTKLTQAEDRRHQTQMKSLLSGPDQASKSETPSPEASQ